MSHRSRPNRKFSIQSVMQQIKSPETPTLILKRCAPEPIFPRESFNNRPIPVHKSSMNNGHGSTHIRIPTCACGRDPRSKYLEFCCASANLGTSYCYHCRRRTPVLLPDLTDDDRFYLSCSCPRCIADARYARDCGFV